MRRVYVEKSAVFKVTHTRTHAHIHARARAQLCGKICAFCSPKYENGEWKIRTNRELEEMSKGENIVKWIKGQG